MRRFLLKSSFFVLVVACAIAWARAEHARRFPFRENYLMATIDKEQILATNLPPRFIAVGGSSVAFGIDTELIGRRCGLTPVNMGVQVALGLSFMLSQVEDRLGVGDVVVLALEYNAFTQHYQAEPEVLAPILASKRSFSQRLRDGEVKQMMDRGYVLRLGTILRSVVTRPTKDPDPAAGIYYRQGFNQHGDLVSYIGRVGRGPRGIRFDYEPGSAHAAIERLNTFHKRCQEHGAKVFLAHPPFSRPLFDESLASIELLEKELRAQLRIPMLDSPRDTAFEPAHFFDTGYHLNADSRTMHSKQIAEALLARGIGRSEQ